MTRSDPDYPSRLKKRLKFDAPPLLFGCGRRELLDKGGLAVVGSRDATTADLAYTTELGRQIAAQGYSVVSGGARGVDETAMLGALEQEGTVVGILADSLLRAATSAKYRAGLMAHNLVLASPFNPEAGFDVGNAMARNKYIYCLADAAVVVTTGRDKGGTWSGALENLRQAWVPLWVKPHPDGASGNAALVERGAAPLPNCPLDLATLMMAPAVVQSTGLFAAPPTIPVSAVTAPLQEPVPKPEALAAPPMAPIPADGAAPTDAHTSEHGMPARLSLYDFFLSKLAEATEAEPQTPESLAENLNLHKSQLSDWLKRALLEGKASKFNKPVRYDAGQRSLRL
jgi:predicted Rossmann fold nucleotide-binding protein DprA/Smf involved in DNA uptake